MAKYKGIIYSYTNRINNKIYIGLTTRERARYIEHKCHSKTKNEHFYNAVKKYGFDSFDYRVIERISSSSLEDLHDKLDEREIYWMIYYNSLDRNFGYNESKGGSSRGAKSRLIDIFDLSGNIVSTAIYIDVTRKYKVNSSSVYYAIKNGNLFQGKYRLAWHDEIPKSRDSHPKSKHIYIQMNLDGLEIKRWNSVMDIQNELNYDSSSIIKCCKGKLKSVHGYLWTRIKK